MGWFHNLIIFYDRKDKDGHTHARILLKFHPGENDPEKRLKDMILAGKLGKIPVFDDYFSELVGD